MSINTTRCETCKGLGEIVYECFEPETCGDCKGKGVVEVEQKGGYEECLVDDSGNCKDPHCPYLH